MGLDADLRTLLLTFDAVTAITGTGDDARIRPDYFPQDETANKSISIEVDNQNHLNDISGKGGLVYADVTLRCRAQQKEDARALAEAIRVNGADPGTGLAGYKGTVAGTVYDAVLEDEQTSRTPMADGSDRGWFDVFCNYVVSYAETT